jgi:hypothetical protein
MFPIVPLEFFFPWDHIIAITNGITQFKSKVCLGHVLLWPSFGCVNEHSVHEHLVRPKIIECNDQFSHKLNKYVQSDRMQKEK